MSMRQSREERFGSEGDVIAEVARMLRDVERYAATARHIHDAQRLASIDASRRSIEGLKLRGAEGPAGVADHFMSWLMARAAVCRPTDSLAAAIAAAEGRRPDDALHVELVTFVRKYLAGEISDEDFTRRWHRALAAANRVVLAEPGEKPQAAVGATTVSQAETRLRQMLTNAGLDLERLDPRRTWDVFKAFADEPVEGPGLDSGDDMCLFEYGVYDSSDGKGPRFNWGLCRQFSLYDSAGEYDHMEQLRCDLFFEVTSDLVQLRLSGIWSDDDLAHWIEEVEAQEGFGAVMGLTPIESRVKQEEV